MEKKKIKLEDLKIESFLTEIDESKVVRIQGGGEYTDTNNKIDLDGTGHFGGTGAPGGGNATIAPPAGGEGEGDGEEDDTTTWRDLDDTDPTCCSDCVCAPDPKILATWP